MHGLALARWCRVAGPFRESRCAVAAPAPIATARSVERGPVPPWAPAGHHAAAGTRPYRCGVLPSHRWVTGSRQARGGLPVHRVHLRVAPGVASPLGGDDPPPDRCRGDRPGPRAPAGDCRAGIVHPLPERWTERSGGRASPRTRSRRAGASLGRRRWRGAGADAGWADHPVNASSSAPTAAGGEPGRGWAGPARCGAPRLPHRGMAGFARQPGLRGRVVVESATLCQGTLLPPRHDHEPRLRSRRTPAAPLHGCRCTCPAAPATSVMGLVGRAAAPFRGRARRP